MLSLSWHMSVDVSKLSKQRKVWSQYAQTLMVNILHYQRSNVICQSKKQIAQGRFNLRHAREPNPERWYTEICEDCTSFSNKLPSNLASHWATMRWHLISNLTWKIENTNRNSPRQVYRRPKVTKFSATRTAFKQFFNVKWNKYRKMRVKYNSVMEHIWKQRRAWNSSDVVRKKNKNKNHMWYDPTTDAK